MNKRIFSKTLSIIIAAAMLLALLPTGIIASAEIVDSGTCGDNLTWTLDDAGNLTISGTGDMWDYDVVDPYPTPTSPWASVHIETVTINNGVTSIGECAFAFHYLPSVTMADTVTSIGDRAFVWGGFGSIKLSSNLERIGVGAFGSSTIKMDTLVLPNGLKYIGNDAFQFCGYILKNVYIPDSVTYIGNYGFDPGFDGFTLHVFKNSYAHLWAQNNNPSSCSFSLEVIEKSGKCSDNLYWNLDGTVLTIMGTGDMYDMYGGSPWPNYITEANIGSGATSIGCGAFEGCADLTSVTIPDSVASIGWSAFYGCTGLTRVNIGNGVTNIGNDAFGDCTALTDITIPDSVTSIGSAFYNTGYSNDKANWENGLLYVGKWLVDADDITGACIINKGTVGIADWTFSRCSDMTEVRIPESVKSVGRAAFYGCTSLTSVTIPDGVTMIEDRTFEDCVNLKTVTMPKSVASIGDDAFGYYDDSDGEYKTIDVTLRVYENSYAHQYAIDNGLKYELIKEPEYKKGDADGDGKITVSDALAALRIAARLVVPTADDYAVLDIDGDGVIAVNDALAILRVAARLVDSL